MLVISKRGIYFGWAKPTDVQEFSSAPLPCWSDVSFLISLGLAASPEAKQRTSSKTTALKHFQKPAFMLATLRSEFSIIPLMEMIHLDHHRLFLNPK